MSNENFTKINEREEFYNSQSSDEKMDTGSESLLSAQNTPNSIQSSEFDDSNDSKSEKALQQESNANKNVLRLSKPIEKDDSLVLNMAKLKLDNDPNNDGACSLSPPKSCLTSTTDHPLMRSNSPEMPELVLKEYNASEPRRGFFHNYQLNTSTNNLYFNDNNFFNDVYSYRRNVTHADAMFDNFVNEKRRRKINNLLDGLGDNDDDIDIEYVVRHDHMSTPNVEYAEESEPEVEPLVEASGLGVAEWCDSPSKLKSLPNFQLPIEMSSSVNKAQELESPGVTSTSTQEDHSSYQALLDPYSGSVALKHNPKHHSSYEDTTPKRKIIALVQDEDAYSSDSEHEGSIQSSDQVHEVPDVHEECSNNDSAQNSQSDSLSIAEYSALEERDDVRSWIKVALPGGGFRSCDMKVIEPYKRVVSHGGYEPTGAAIIVFSACHLPHSDRRDYNYVMDNLFLYVLKTLEMLVTDDYILVYLHGSASKSKIPTFHWLHECYKLIDRRLRKSLKHLYLVHPTFWIKTIVILCKPFVSSKFFRKITYVKNLKDLMDRIPVEPNAIPDLVREYDAIKR